MALKEYVEGGLEPDEVIEFIRRVEDKIDMVHISSRDWISLSGLHLILRHQVSCLMESMWSLPRRAKEVLHIPVCTVGGIMMPQEAEEILGKGLGGNTVALGRGLIADPDWPEESRTWPHGGDYTLYPMRVRLWGGYRRKKPEGVPLTPDYTRQLRLKTEETGPVEALPGGGAGGKAVRQGCRPP